jgi:DNA-binding NarL/FixJ family response regulator
VEADLGATLVPVIVAAPKLWSSNNLTRRLSQRDGFVVVEGSLDPRHLLIQCRQITPCVLIVEEEVLSRFEAGEFAHAVDFGRLVRVLVVASGQNEDAALAFARMGCMGSITDESAPGTLRKAVRALFHGEMWFDRVVLARLVRQLLLATSSPKLTPRETDIAKLIGRGCSNRLIAQTLSISHETVRWHVRSIHSKLGIRDRRAAAQYAQRYLDG